MSAVRREDRFFDLLVELCEHAEAKGMTEVSQRLEEAMDALLDWEAGADAVPFRSVRDGTAVPLPRLVPRERRLTFAG
jgi:hypothetical protein